MSPNPVDAPSFVTGLAAHGDRPAVVSGATRLTHSALADRVAEDAASLGDGRRLVLIAGGNELGTLVAYLAALAAGHVAWLAPPRHVADLVAAFDPDVVVTPDGERARVELRRAAPGHDLHPRLALLLGTSGTTGAPRLVRLSHENLDANAESVALSLDIGPGDRAITTLPMHYCYGLSVVHSHLLRGAAVVLTDRSVADGGFWELARRERVTTLAGVPHTFDLLDRVGFAGMDLPDLRLVTQAGGRLAPAAARRHARLGERRGWRFAVMYGQTEATARMTCTPPGVVADHPDAIGVPVAGGALELRPVPEATDSGVGEIVYRGPNVMLGYARGPADLARGRDVDELRTGDLGRLGPDGLYRVVGRRSRFLKLFGLRVDLDELERRLERDGVRAACAGDDERLVIAALGAPPPPGLARRVARQIGIPAGRIEVRSLEEAPRLPSGKTDYAAIAAADGPAAVAVAGAGGALADRIAAALRDVLDVDEVHADDSFATLGGDSLSYVEMSLALEEILGRLPEGWESMTVGALAASAVAPARGARVETNVLLRAAAIALVVASHMTAFWPAGGAHLLLGLAGHSFARFWLAASAAPRRWTHSALSVARIAVPSMVWIAAMSLVVGGYGLGTVLLVNNYTGAPEHSGGRWHYWFIEAIVQITVVLAILIAIPPVRRLERRAPFAFAAGLLGAALLVRFDLVRIGDDANEIFRPHAVAWIFLLGWAVHRATDAPRRVAVSAAILASLPGFFGEPARELIIAGGLLLLLWVPAVTVPRVLVRPLGLVAAASLIIYLTHWQVFPPLRDALPIGIAIPATLAVGVAAWWALERLGPWAAGAARAGAAYARRSPSHSSAASATAPRSAFSE